MRIQKRHLSGMSLVSFMIVTVRVKFKMAFTRVLTEHINHIRTVAGVDHVGIGSDFCGAPMPFGLEDSSTYPILIAALIEDNSTLWTDEELGLLASGNLIR